MFLRILLVVGFVLAAGVGLLLLIYRDSVTTAMYANKNPEYLGRVRFSYMGFCVMVILGCLALAVASSVGGFPYRPRPGDRG